MKSFVTSLILILLMLGGILLNALYINNVETRIKNEISSLTEPTHTDTLTATIRIRDHWEKDARRIHISVNHTVVDRITEQMEVLAACAACGDVYGFYTAKALLLDALEDMRRLERIGAVL